MSAYKLKTAKNEIQAIKSTIHNGVQQKDIGFSIYVYEIHICFGFSRNELNAILALSKISGPIFGSTLWETFLRKFKNWIIILKFVFMMEELIILLHTILSVSKYIAN